MDSVKLKMDLKGPAAAAEMFVLDIVDALDLNNASQIIKDREPCKHLITRLVDKLGPQELRDRIRDARELWTVEQNGNLSFFQTETSKLPAEISIGEAARLRLKRRHCQSDSKEQTAHPAGLASGVPHLDFVYFCGERRSTTGI